MSSKLTAVSKARVTNRRRSTVGAPPSRHPEERRTSDLCLCIYSGAGEERQRSQVLRFAQNDGGGARSKWQKRPLVGWITLLIFFITQATHALEFKAVEHAGKKFTVCQVDPTVDKLHLFLRDGTGQYFKSFEGIERALAPRGERLLFGMNAGMYRPGLAPEGWFVTGGQELAPINLAKGEGNFFLKPNGVFLITANGARILEASQAAALAEKVELATQSGPLLVIAGQIHPAFRPQSDSKLFRNGVGVKSPREVFFAITEEPVNFYQFATLFRDALHCPDALFFDGTVSSLHAPELKRSEKKIDLGPMIGVIGPLPKPQP